MNREAYLKQFSQRRAKMKRLFAEGVKAADIARRYRITPERVRQILNGKERGNRGSP